MATPATVAVGAVPRTSSHANISSLDACIAGLARGSAAGSLRWRDHCISPYERYVRQEELLRPWLEPLPLLEALWCAIYVLRDDGHGEGNLQTIDPGGIAMAKRPCACMQPHARGREACQPCSHPACMQPHARGREACQPCSHPACMQPPRARERGLPALLPPLLLLLLILLCPVSVLAASLFSPRDP